MELDIFLKPIDLIETEGNKNNFGNKIDAFIAGSNVPEISGKDIAIIGVEEDRASIGNKSCGKAPNKIRKHLYNLFDNFQRAPKIADLGNIIPGETLNDTYFAISEVVSTLVKKNITVIILGGSQDITFGNYRAYEKLEQVVNLVCVDERFNMGDNDDSINSNNYLNKIVLHQPNFLFNYSNLGYQTYFEPSSTIELMSRLHFDVHRLGEINKTNISETEPTFRNADIASFDISSVRSADAPGNNNASPNGLYAEEFCQLARYAGMSDKISSVGFYECNPQVDVKEQTSQLVAQAVWCFIDGYYNRKNEHPIINSDQFFKFRVIIEEENHEIVFYKSTKSDRWWMDVPYPNHKSKYSRHHLVPCTHQDYTRACNEGIPERWWKTFQKLL